MTSVDFDDGGKQIAASIDFVVLAMFPIWQLVAIDLAFFVPNDVVSVMDYQI